MFAVHFKGKKKPWELSRHRENLGRTRGACEARAAEGKRLRLLPLNASRGAPATDLVGADDFVWSASDHACISERRRGLRMAWASGEPLSRPCCCVEVALEVEWRALRADFCVKMRHRSRSGAVMEPRMVAEDCRVYARYVARRG